MRLRPASLLWGAFLALGLAALGLQLRSPGHPAVPRLTLGLLALLALRLADLTRQWRRGELPGARLLLPGILLVEGLGLLQMGGRTGALPWKVATAVALEGLLLVLAVRALRRARAHPGARPEDTLAGAFTAFVPPVAARLMALELVVLGSGLRFLVGGWRRPAPSGFSLHRESTLRAFLPALPLMIPGDLLLVQVALGRAPTWARALLHGLDAYALLWLLGFYATLRARPHQVQGGRVDLHMGVFGALSLPRGHLAAACALPPFDDGAALRAHAQGAHRLVRPGTPLVELCFTRPIPALGLLGTPGQPRDRAVVSVDEPGAFLAALGAPCT